jgi:hypothetical protein
MPDTKISAMPSASTLTGAELVPLVQGGVNVQATLGDVKDYVTKVYGGWSSTQTQTASTTTGTAITYNVQDVTDSVTLVNNSRITVPVTGVYNLQFSAQLKNTDNAQHIATIWIRINGTDVGATSTNITVPSRKTSNIYGYGVAAWNFFLDMNANDYVELFWLVESTLVTMEALPASVTPQYPSIPSVIVTIAQV